MRFFTWEVKGSKYVHQIGTTKVWRMNGFTCEWELREPVEWNHTEESLKTAIKGENNRFLTDEEAAQFVKDNMLDML